MSIWSDKKFALFWENTELRAETLDLSEPCLPCQRKVSRRFESGGAEASFPTSANCSYFRQIYYEGLDLIIICIKNCFEQHGYMIYWHLQDVLLNAAGHTDYSGDFDFVTSFYGIDFDSQRLKTQLVYNHV